MSLAHFNLNRKAELDALERFGNACEQIASAAPDGPDCDDLEAARDVLREIECAVCEAQAAIRGKESRRPL
jgi:hypothetical protein